MPGQLTLVWNLTPSAAVRRKRERGGHCLRPRQATRDKRHTTSATGQRQHRRHRHHHRRRRCPLLSCSQRLPWMMALRGCKNCAKCWGGRRNCIAIERRSPSGGISWRCVSTPSWSSKRIGAAGELVLGTHFTKLLDGNWAEKAAWFSFCSQFKCGQSLLRMCQNRDSVVVCPSTPFQVRLSSFWLVVSVCVCVCMLLVVRARKCAKQPTPAPFIHFSFAQKKAAFHAPTRPSHPVRLTTILQTHHPSSTTTTTTTATTTTATWAAVEAENPTPP